MSFQDSALIMVAGRVSRTFSTRNGEAFEVEYTKANAKYPDRVTVWTTLPVREGDRVIIRGAYSDGIDTYTNRDGVQNQKIKRSVNDAVLVDHEPATVADTDSSEPW